MASVSVRSYHPVLRDIEVEVTLDGGVNVVATVSRNILPPNILAEQVLTAVGTAATTDDVIAAVEGGTYSFPNGLF